MFNLTCISSALEFGSVNHTSIYEHSELSVFKNIKLFWTKYIVTDHKRFMRNRCVQDNLVDNCCYQYCNGRILLP